MPNIQSAVAFFSTDARLLALVNLISLFVLCRLIYVGIIGAARFARSWWETSLSVTIKRYRMRNRKIWCRASSDVALLISLLAFEVGLAAMSAFGTIVIISMMVLDGYGGLTYAYRSVMPYYYSGALVLYFSMCLFFCQRIIWISIAVKRLRMRRIKRGRRLRRWRLLAAREVNR